MQQDRTVISELIATDNMREVMFTKAEKQRIRRESKLIQLLTKKLSISKEQPEPLLLLCRVLSIRGNSDTYESNWKYS
jgi:hypothetical protein